MERKTFIVAILIVASLLFIVCFSYCRCKKPIKTEPDSIDSLLLINDSLHTQIDSINTQIIDINEWYEQTYGIVLNQPTDSDLIFFTNYLNSIPNFGFSGSDNNTTTQTN